jgi:4-diphosphocytidyl-2-C-methyl-D-erythritol kinase
MDTVTLSVNAKVNLSLNITGRTCNGYHCLDTLMASVDIADKITLSRRADGNVTVTMTDGAGAPIDLRPECNNAYKIYTALRDAFRLPGCDISIVKNIPFSAGMGGSSADSAGVLRAAGRLFGLNVKSSGAYVIAFKSGGDVPYMLDGGYARVRGRGERITRVPSGLTLHLLVAKGKSGCATRASYAEFDKERTNCGGGGGGGGAAGARRGGGAEAAVRALMAGDVEALAASMRNDLQACSARVCPEILSTLDALRGTNPLNAIMTGSGSACFGIYRTAEECETARAALDGVSDYCAVCRTVL